MPITLNTVTPSVAPGELITITGTGLLSVTLITFSTAAAEKDQAPSSVTDTQLTVEAPELVDPAVTVCAINATERSNELTLAITDGVPFETVTPLCTLPGLKSFLGIKPEEKHNEAQLLELIQLASAAMTKKMRRQFGVRSFTETYSGDGSNILLLRQTPVAAVQSLTIDGVAVATSEFKVHEQSIQFEFDADFNPRLRGSRIFPRGNRNIAITYTAGFARIPADIPGACMHQVVFLKNLAAKQGMISESNQTAGTTDSYSQEALCSQALIVCNRYRRFLQAGGVI